MSKRHVAFRDHLRVVLNVVPGVVPGVLLGCLILVAVSGCAHRVWNDPIDHPAAGERYDFRHRLPDNSPELFVILAFSGGGTRAASFSYGVLEALRDTSVTIGGTERRLLDEVDVITSVSGGSYTAAYYGLFGDRIFQDFRDDFLYRNWQRELLLKPLLPSSLASMMASNYNRTDLVAAHLGNTLFEDATYARMSRGKLPFVIVNATDLNNATTFSFIQQQFDFLCSDLSSYPVANAVMASAAVPGLFASMALRNHPGCDERDQPWVETALAEDGYLARRRTVARALARYADPERMPILRLVDGGVSDNLGVRGSMMSPVAHEGNVAQMAGAFTDEALRRVRDVLVVVVNAQVYRQYDWSVRGREPGVIRTVKSSFDTALGILNTETVSLAKDGFLMWAERANAVRALDDPQVEVQFAVLTFDQLDDAATRERFNAMPTTFRLGADEVDALIMEAGELLRRSPEVGRLLERLEDHARADAAPASDGP